MTDPRRATPRVDAVLADPRLIAAVERLGPALVRAAVSRALDEVRSGRLPAHAAADMAVAALPASAAALRRVLNATGVIVHTNLGRSALSPAAVAAVSDAAGYTDVEFDLAAGVRAKRGAEVLSALRAAVPGAEAVHVVNNNAAALALTVFALASGREVVVSRGELIEIGDGFRIPELLTAAGAVLREVGTTNRTRLSDYADAIGPNTALVMRLHPSNYRVTGFTSAPSLAELATLDVPVVYDIGSGLLSPEPLLPDEPDAASALAGGAAMVTASGDKLLGGPQAGLIFGRADLVTRLARHPLARALRVDKLTLAALEATVRGPLPPTTAALRASVTVLRERAERLAATLADAGVDVEVVDSGSTVGGGGAPGVVLPSVALSLPTAYAAVLRAGELPVVGRVSAGRCLLDLRTIAPHDDPDLLNAVLSAAKQT
ncbi:L-seryl-tRNA(Sec) selenium transferase [Asanoa ishikariensis]|uniref:L-seryl-tRNA(Sec) selenium transferase n=1 Tax=Asanoa ishikariensis TaxID=137265 RepID=A0A1H3KW94_9ACTN|nr:L-seryl-tRNA(Sec) selenium transferase [Asanoa ishikariensis]GIF69651.1 L-seryl-tRNA(Sec) selenium transferase [Asanoa ishikariensis]SDY56432.1 L-seryl-tRNA(Sec) selenium transferase [Asanoa ishikariensis]